MSERNQAEEEVSSEVKGLAGVEFSNYPSGLTVGAMEMLLHYYYTPVDVEDALDGQSQNYRDIKQLEKAGLAKLSRNPHGSWALTERGEVMARHIMETPLPQPVWVIPEAK